MVKKMVKNCKIMAKMEKKVETNLKKKKIKKKFFEINGLFFKQKTRP